ncbi:MAG: SDR family NAD(P)-dependent oxidoreductase [Cyanobacteriota bacterium]|nr:SDR family NAD(P)-dependent oxidoreductase [Cyanobacteriota bacterium]
MSASDADSPPPWHHWQGHGLVVGAGGIGQALLRALPERAPRLRLWSAGRQGADLPLDLEDPASLEAFAERALEELAPLRLVICAAGLLHGPDLQPEKRLSQVSAASLRRGFAVNAWGPLLLAKAVEGALPRKEPSHFASLSARVGSIGDNRLGGWYAYRGAKAAQNQLLRTLALEWRRRLPMACVTLLHPGTTATALSAPFRSSVAPTQLFTPERAAGHLLEVLEGQTPETSGSFLAWDGQSIPW